MMATLREYRIDGKRMFDPANPESERTLTSYARFVDTMAEPPNERGMEKSESLNARLRPRLIITDDNMGWEWRSLDNTESHYQDRRKWRVPAVPGGTKAFFIANLGRNVIEGWPWVALGF
jgi:hypothetical protein